MDDPLTAATAKAASPSPPRPTHEALSQPGVTDVKSMA